MKMHFFLFTLGLTCFMTEKTDKKYLIYLVWTDDIDKNLRACRKQPIILSDSKECYLKRNACNTIERKMVWWCEGCLSTVVGLKRFLGSVNSDITGCL